MDPALAAFSLATEEGFIQPAMRGPGRAYAAARPADPGADDETRLLAFVGRTTAWR